MQKITPCLWFDECAEEAVKFYTSIFKNSKIGTVTRYGEAGAKASGRPRGTVMTITFELNGQEFMALNGGPYFRFTEALSFVVYCRTQREVDRFWLRLSKGGEKGRCGWLKDRYGVSWQIVPAALGEILKSKESQKSERAMKLLLTMGKLDIKALQHAYAGR